MQDSKSTAERQQEIIEAAKSLFFTKGYEQTSTVDIMRSVGIAKGTLYYHFKSKEEILDAIIEDITDDMAERATCICEDDSLSVVQKMVSIIKSINIGEQDKGAVMEAIHLPNNALLHQKSYKLMIEKLSPLMLAVVQQGIVGGLFDSEYPEAAVDMAMTYSLTAFGETVKNDTAKGFIYNLERLLGAKSGTLAPLIQLF